MNPAPASNALVAEPSTASDVIGAIQPFCVCASMTPTESPEPMAMVRRVVTLGYGALEVVNLYAYVATDPADLRRFSSDLLNSGPAQGLGVSSAQPIEVVPRCA